MSGTIDGYRFENVTKDTLYVMRDVRRTIDGWAKKTHEIDLDYNPYEGSGNKNEFVNKICDDCIHDESDRMKAVFAFVEQAQRKAINMSESEAENDGYEMEF